MTRLSAEPVHVLCIYVNAKPLANKTHKNADSGLKTDGNTHLWFIWAA